MRNVIRSDDTEFVYKRPVQPQPKLGAWRAEQAAEGKCGTAGARERWSARSSELLIGRILRRLATTIGQTDANF